MWVRAAASRLFPPETHSRLSWVPSCSRFGGTVHITGCQAGERLEPGHWAWAAVLPVCVRACVCVPPSLTFDLCPPQGRGGGRAPGEDAGAEQRKDGQERGEVCASMIVTSQNTTNKCSRLRKCIMTIIMILIFI